MPRLSCYRTAPGCLTAPATAGVGGAIWRRSAEYSCHLVRKIDQSDTAAACVETFLSGHLLLVATILACVMAADLGLKARDLSLLTYATTELEKRVEAAAAGAGGMRAWLDTQWPREPTFASTAGTIGISCAANDAFWRVFMAGLRPVDVPLPDDSVMAKGLRQMALVPDWILDRAGVAPGAPGERVAALARLVLHAVPSPDGEPRLERWQDAVRERRAKEVPELVLRDHASVHAAILHAIVVVTDLRVARWLAIGDTKIDAWRPEIPLRQGSCRLEFSFKS